MGLISELERCPGEGHGNPLQYACLDNPMDRGALQATVHEVTRSQTRMKRLVMHACMHVHNLSSLKSLIKQVTVDVLTADVVTVF